MKLSQLNKMKFTNELTVIQKKMEIKVIEEDLNRHKNDSKENFFNNQKGYYLKKPIRSKSIIRVINSRTVLDQYESEDKNDINKEELEKYKYYEEFIRQSKNIKKKSSSNFDKNKSMKFF